MQIIVVESPLNKLFKEAFEKNKAEKGCIRPWVAGRWWKGKSAKHY